MKSDTARQTSLMVIAILASALTMAQAAGPKDFGQRVAAPSGGQPLAGPKDFGQ